MQTKLTRQKVLLFKMSPEERLQFAQEIAELITQIFEVKDQERVINNFANPKNDVINVEVYRNNEGQMVGFQKATIDYSEKNGKKIASFNSHAGFLRAYRGHSSTLVFALRNVLVEKLIHPTWAMHYFGILIHPSSFYLFTRYAPAFWPRWDCPTPRDQLEMMLSLADEHADPGAVYNKKYPLVRYYYLGTQTLKQEQNYWANSEKSAVKYFLRINPRYADSAGVFFWIDLDARFFITVIMRMLGERMRRTMHAFRASLYKSRLGKRLLARPDIPLLLQDIPLFQKLKKMDRNALAESAGLVSFKPGNSIIRQGEPGDSMYVILVGSAYVLMEDGGQEEIIDQLNKGHYFGEMSLLSGEPRSASIRSATSITLVKISREALKSVLRSHPRLEDELWQVFSQRSFDRFLSGHKDYAGLEWEDRLNWHKSGEQKKQDKGDPVENIPAFKLLFLFTGQGEVKQGDLCSMVKAPAILDFTRNWTFEAKTSSRYNLLNPL